MRFIRSICVTATVVGACSSPLPPEPARTPPAPTPDLASSSQPEPSLAIAVATRLAPAQAARSWGQLRIDAAQRIVATNPDGTYEGPPPEVLLAIPVLEIELKADGSIRRIVVLRQPGQARDTTQLAIDAVRRAAPFGDVSRLPRPWKWSETFLFNDERKFKPRTLDL